MYDTTILIPYRHRKQHLDYWLDNTAPLLFAECENMRIIILEQSGSKAFNRGKLLNVGFAKYKNDTCYFITHDVDINPNRKAIVELYTQPVTDNNVLGIYTSYLDTLGGIIKIGKNTIQRINGFPNDYWGWGCEDRALYNRCVYYNINITKNILNNNPDSSNYFTIFNDVDDRVLNNINKRTSYEYNDFSILDTSMKIRRIKGSGLSTLNYKLLDAKTISPNIEHIVVDIDCI